MAILVLIAVIVMLGGMIWREERAIAAERRQRAHAEEAFQRAQLGDHTPATPRCDHKPVPVKLAVTGEVVRHLCSECLEEVPAPPIPPKGGGGSSRTHDLTKTSAPVREADVTPIATWGSEKPVRELGVKRQKVRLLGGPYDGQAAAILGDLDHIAVAGARYEAIRDPDTGENLGGYAFRAGGVV